MVHGTRRALLYAKTRPTGGKTATDLAQLLSGRYSLRLVPLSPGPLSGRAKMVSSPGRASQENKEVRRVVRVEKRPCV